MLTLALLLFMLTKLAQIPGNGLAMMNTTMTVNRDFACSHAGNEYDHVHIADKG